MLYNLKILFHQGKQYIPDVTTGDFARKGERSRTG
jgi:hypothetical protein